MMAFRHGNLRAAATMPGYPFHEKPERLMEEALGL